MAIVFMVIDAQNMLTTRIPAFSALAGSPYFFHTYPFQIGGLNKKAVKVSCLPLRPKDF